MEPHDDERLRALVVAVAEALHEAGAPCGHIETMVGRLAAAVGLPVQTFSTLTALFVGFGDPARGRTALVRLSPGDVDLGRLADLDEAVECLVAGGCDANALAAAVAAIRAKPRRRHGRWRLVTGAVGAAAWAWLLGGEVVHIAIAAQGGLLVGLLALAAARLGGPLGQTPEAIAGALVGATVAGTSRAFGVPLSDVPILAALVPFLPGLPLAVGTEEVARKDLITGTVRLVSAALTFAMLFLGVAVGVHLVGAQMMDSIGSATPPPLAAAIVAIVPALALSVVRFDVRPHDVPWFYVSALLGAVAGRSGAQALGPELGAFVGALLVGLCSNAAARWLGRPVLLTQLPGILMLIPGVLGLRSIVAVWNAHLVRGLGAALAVMLVLLAMTLGLLAAATLIAPRQTARALASRGAPPPFDEGRSD